jgi:hypothetical protein
MNRGENSGHGLRCCLLAAGVISMTFSALGAAVSTARTIPSTLSNHPGNIYLLGENVMIRVPETVTNTAIEWRLLDDRLQVLRTGLLPAAGEPRPERIEFGALDLGWYRLQFGRPGDLSGDWTTAAVLPPFKSAPSSESPIAVDSATAWFAKNQPERQRHLANLAALAGASWVRDRLRWGELQPAPGPLTNNATTYDTAAEAQQGAGLQVLQVFHDTPSWARENPGASGRFAPDLRAVYAFARASAQRFHGKIAAWEPWNEANVATFGGHTVDQMCSWQKAAYLGFKAGDPQLIIGWNATTAVPSPSHTQGVLSNQTWPYFDTYNIHTYDWAHAYADLWRPAREAACGRPLWITEADRGTPHLGIAPWFDQDPRLERLKAEYMAQSYASSLFAGAQRHFHFILGHYHEPNRVQFGLLRLDDTPRPAYVALAAVGRYLADARVLGRWRPGNDVQVYAFRARPDQEDHDVLVIWAEKDVDWDGRGQTAVDWKLPDSIEVRQVIDYLGRPLGRQLPSPVSSAPHFVFLPPGQAITLPLELPPAPVTNRASIACPVVLQLELPSTRSMRVEDIPWSEGYVYGLAPDETLRLPLNIYNFSERKVQGRLEIAGVPPRWQITYPGQPFAVGPQGRTQLVAALKVPPAAATNGWVIFRASCGNEGPSVLAARFMIKSLAGQSP